MQQTIYIETSIPSFYYEDRSDAAAVARREWTRKWWDDQRHHFELFSSHAVLDELKKGEYAKQADCLLLLDDVPFLRIESEITEITTVM
jgi:hypothetical protein